MAMVAAVIVAAMCAAAPACLLESTPSPSATPSPTPSPTAGRRLEQIQEESEQIQEEWEKTGVFPCQEGMELLQQMADGINQLAALGEVGAEESLRKGWGYLVILVLSEKCLLPEADRTLPRSAPDAEPAA